MGNIVPNDGDMTALKKLNFKDEIYCFKSSHVFSQIKFTCPNFFDTSVNNVIVKGFIRSIKVKLVKYYL